MILEAVLALLAFLAGFAARHILGRSAPIQWRLAEMGPASEPQDVIWLNRKTRKVALAALTVARLLEGRILLEWMKQTFDSSSVHPMETNRAFYLMGQQSVYRKCVALVRLGCLAANGKVKVEEDDADASIGTREENGTE